MNVRGALQAQPVGDAPGERAASEVVAVADSLQEHTPWRSLAAELAVAGPVDSAQLREGLAA